MSPSLTSAVIRDGTKENILVAFGCQDSKCDKKIGTMYEYKHTYGMAKG